MTSIGSNLASSSEVSGSGGPLAPAKVSLTLEEQLQNFERIIRILSVYYPYIGSLDVAFLKSVAKVVKELRNDPCGDIKSLPLVWDLYGLLRRTTPLHWAVLIDDRAMVHYILSSGMKVDINASTKNPKETALSYAAMGGNCEIVKDLLGYKADVFMCTRLNQSAFAYMVAQKDSMFGILKSILADNVNVCDQSKNTALHYAAREGAIDVVTYLLNEKADVNLHNEDGYTPLHFAAKKGSLDVVTHLLQQNADVNALTNSGKFSPLHFAAREGAIDVVAYLLNEKADVNLQNEDGYTPLHFAVREESLDVVTCLLQQNADVNALTNSGKFSPLHFATMKGATNIVSLLVQHNADKDALDNQEGRSPLLYAIYSGSVDLSNGLIANGANVHGKDKKDNNALHLAIYTYRFNHNMMDIVKLLRERDVDANAKNAQGYSPFFGAVFEGHTEVVKELLQSKEKIKLTEECNGQTVIQIAFDCGHEHIKRTLLECDDVSRYVGDLYRDRQVYVDAANAILVGAALIASVTFASWLQPPLGYTSSYLDLAPSSSDINYVDVQHNVPLRWFWIFNTLSFYFAIGTVVFGARSVLPRRQMFIKAIVGKLHQNLLYTSILLACSVFCVIIAFGIAGCIVLTPTLEFQLYMIVPTIFGGLVCLFSLGCLFKSMVEDNLKKKREPYLRWH